MSYCPFKIGDRVKIRSWDDMADEFGVIESGAHGRRVIRVRNTYFVPEMKHLCGRKAEVCGVSSSCVYLAFIESFPGRKSWHFTADMLELAGSPDSVEIPLCNLVSVLNNAGR